ncbi:uncharacterized protein N0V89_011124 [Didymosphaeria variabile]|uniref:Uncharacterized protein n=1 Tax=Didymosphaeria variabile TaxID=1932322 RepID=A0A9W8XCY2_9PLEO|nr:uncharacterized protein N0V89_011124 [Didymosphaeria variabile]KAJ4347185.1 hypothetical protein N0V89_011124 [Didymosphaeria variabile]
MCQSASDNLQLDTGYLDSWGDLGMNAEPRFQIRLKQNCAPLVTRGYKMRYVDPTDTSKTYMRYSYLRNNTITNSTADVADWRIYMVPLKSPFDQVVSSYGGSIGLDYRTRSISMYRGEDTDFIPELNRTDAYAALLFLDSTDMVYHEKVEDPWFAANTNASELMRTFFESESLYVSDEPATVIGCTSQAFYCNPRIDNGQQRCVNLYASHELRDSITAIWPEPDDLKAFLGYVQTNNIMIATPDTFYNMPGLPNMLARFTTKGIMQWEAFPRDRWKQEMEFLSQASLASFQSNVPQASQNGVWDLDRTLCDSDTEAGLCEKLCKSQVSGLNLYILAIARIPWVRQ